MECVGEGKGMEGNRWEEKKERDRQERNGRKWKKRCNWDSVAKKVQLYQTVKQLKIKYYSLPFP